MRPARSTSAPLCSASIAASGDACTPAAHITVRAAMRSVPARSARRRRTRRRPRRGHPSAARHRALRAPRGRLPRAGRRTSPAVPCRRRAGPRAPTRVRRTEVGRRRAPPARGSDRRARHRWARADHPIVSHSPRSASSAVVSASSKAPSRPPAQLERVVDRLHARARRARTRRGRSTTAPNRRGDDEAVVRDVDGVAGTRRAHDARSRSKPVTSASSTRTFFALRRTCRSAGAIWPGERSPVATW